MEPKVIAKAILLDERGKVLLLRRTLTDTQRPGQQDFPGGGKDPGEDITAGVRREILEEAGLDVPSMSLKLFYASHNVYEVGPVVQLLFYAHVKNPVVDLSYEHDAFQWLLPDEAVLAFPHPFYGEGLKYGIQHNIFI